MTTKSNDSAAICSSTVRESPCMSSRAGWVCMLCAIDSVGLARGDLPDTFARSSRRLLMDIHLSTSSTPNPPRPVLRQAINVDPDPEKGSSTLPPFLVKKRISFSMSFSAKVAGCCSLSSSRGGGRLCQTLLVNVNHSTLLRSLSLF